MTQAAVVVIKKERSGRPKWCSSLGGIAVPSLGFESGRQLLPHDIHVSRDLRFHQYPFQEASGGLDYLCGVF